MGVDRDREKSDIVMVIPDLESEFDDLEAETRRIASKHNPPAS